MNKIIFGIAAVMLVLATLACGGGGTTPSPTQPPPPPPTQPPPPPTQPPQPPAALDWSLDPNFGDVELEPGFLPDPYTVDIVSGGGVDVGAAGIGTDCVGYATQAPDFDLYLQDDSDELRIFFVAATGEDTALIINTPDGEWLCNDDYDGTDPMVVIQNAAAGLYDIWVASYSSDVLAEGTLYITEMDLSPADYAGGGGESAGLDWSLDPNFGDVELEPGFLPDPYTVDIVSGGGVDVGAAGIGTDCVGYATQAPDFDLYLQDDSDELRIFFVAATGEDTALIINTPDGEWLCNDDYDGTDPMVVIQNAAAGLYDIWVASYSSDVLAEGTLYITEMDLSPADYAGGEAGATIRQWASYATASSQYGDDGWSAAQATGAPDTDECGDYPTAWASQDPEGEDWLEVYFDTAVIPTEINIYETHSPGYIVEVEVIDEDGNYYSAWTGDPDPTDDCPYISTLTFNQADLAVIGVRIHLDQAGGSWDEIDAVELVGVLP